MPNGANAERRECRTAQMPHGANCQMAPFRRRKRLRAIHRSMSAQFKTAVFAFRAFRHSRPQAFAPSGISRPLAPRAVWHLAPLSRSLYSQTVYI
jgi:hypothetical protein